MNVSHSSSLRSASLRLFALLRYAHFHVHRYCMCKVRKCAVLPWQYERLMNKTPTVCVNGERVSCYSHRRLQLIQSVGLFCVDRQTPLRHSYTFLLRMLSTFGQNSLFSHFNGDLLPFTSFVIGCILRSLPFISVMREPKHNLI